MARHRPPQDDDGREDAGRLIGRLVLHFQELEQLVNELFCALFAIEPERGGIIARIVSFEQKLSMIDTLLSRDDLRPRDEELLAEIKDVLAHVRRMKSQRNFFVHARYSETPLENGERGRGRPDRYDRRRVEEIASLVPQIDRATAALAHIRARLKDHAPWSGRTTA